MHSDRFHYGGVIVGRSLEDNGYLAMNIGLGEGAFGLPAIGGEESHLDVIWKERGMMGRQESKTGQTCKEMGSVAMKSNTDSWINGLN